MDTHVCPTCSQPCAYKNGIMCTIQGCVKDGSNKDMGNIFNTLFPDDGGKGVDKLRKVFGMDN